MDGEGREGLTGFATGHSDRTHIAAFGSRLTVRNHKNAIVLVGTYSEENIAVSVQDMSYNKCIIMICMSPGTKESYESYDIFNK